MKKIFMVCFSLVMTSGIWLSISSCEPSHKTPSDSPGMQSDSLRMQNGGTDTTMVQDTSRAQNKRR